jgi:hypothetical protein
MFFVCRVRDGQVLRLLVWSGLCARVPLAPLFYGGRAVCVVGIELPPAAAFFFCVSASRRPQPSQCDRPRPTAFGGSDAEGRLPPTETRKAALGSDKRVSGAWPTSMVRRCSPKERERGPESETIEVVEIPRAVRPSSPPASSRASQMGGRVEDILMSKEDPSPVLRKLAEDGEMGIRGVFGS